MNICAVSSSSAPLTGVKREREPDEPTPDAKRTKETAVFKISSNTAFQKFTLKPAAPLKRLYNPLYAATRHLSNIAPWVKYLEEYPFLREITSDLTKVKASVYKLGYVGLGITATVDRCMTKTFSLEFPASMPSVIKYNPVAFFFKPITRHVGDRTTGIEERQKIIATRQRVQEKKAIDSIYPMESELLNLRELEGYNPRHLLALPKGLLLYPFQMGLIMPDGGPSLKDLIRIRRSFAFKEMRVISRQLFETLEDLHKILCIHGDIKPENILLRSLEEGIKVIDWGLAQCCANIIYDNIQTRWYRAPEAAAKKVFGIQVDWWSATCLLFEVFTLKPLFCSSSDADHLPFIREILGPPSSDIERGVFRTEVEAMPISEQNLVYTRIFKERGVHPEARDPITGWILKTAQERGEGLVEAHAFADMLLSILTYDQDLRPSPHEILDHPFIKNFNNNPVNPIAEKAPVL